MYLCVVFHTNTLRIFPYCNRIMRRRRYLCYFIYPRRNPCQFQDTIGNRNACTFAKNRLCCAIYCLYSNIDILIAFRYTTDMEYGICNFFLSLIVQFFYNQTAFISGCRRIGILRCIRDCGGCVVGHFCRICSLRTEVINIPLPVTGQTYGVPKIAGGCI